ncbi:Lacal_2735 family protein [Ulvibacterium sp.]|uniref:Lacal_2735 family protein n=1 Tax=Ulvibacterium sp. TaxID=2665914 RepID=UPI00261A1E3C|nr:Lacal_2735 family protein [Ulvibacterium sp.]
MFGLFKKKSEVEKLQEKYQKLMKEAFDLSKSNRSASDTKYAEADEVQKKIEALTTSSKTRS